MNFTSEPNMETSLHPKQYNNIPLHFLVIVVAISSIVPPPLVLYFRARGFLFTPTAYWETCGVEIQEGHVNIPKRITHPKKKKKKNELLILFIRTDCFPLHTYRILGDPWCTNSRGTCWIYIWESYIYHILWKCLLDSKRLCRYLYIYFFIYKIRLSSLPLPRSLYSSKWICGQCFFIFMFYVLFFFQIFKTFFI